MDSLCCWMSLFTQTLKILHVDVVLLFLYIYITIYLVNFLKLWIDSWYWSCRWCYYWLFWKILNWSIRLSSEQKWAHWLMSMGTRPQPNSKLCVIIDFIDCRRFLLNTWFSLFFWLLSLRIYAKFFWRHWCFFYNHIVII